MPSQYQPPPSMFAPPQTLVKFRMRLVEVNGNLTVFSQHKGFRNYIKAKADELGITGTIQRYHHKDVLIEYEGTESQVKDLSEFLNDCNQQGMIERFMDIESQVIVVRFYQRFTIVKDFSRTVDKGGKIIKGAYSDELHDKISLYSANSEVYEEVKYQTVMFK
eukprot:gene28732-37976_t